jgi:hypothetical protein
VRDTLVKKDTKLIYQTNINIRQHIKLYVLYIIGHTKHNIRNIYNNMKLKIFQMTLSRDEKGSAMENESEWESCVCDKKMKFSINLRSFKIFLSNSYYTSSHFLLLLLPPCTVKMERRYASGNHQYPYLCTLLLSSFSTFFFKEKMSALWKIREWNVSIKNMLGHVRTCVCVCMRRGR